MATYVDSILRGQAEMAAHFYEEQTITLKHYQIPGMKQEQKSVLPEEQKQQMQMQEDSQQTAKQLLQNLQQLQQSAARTAVVRQNLHQTQINLLQQEQGVNVMQRTPENTSGGLTGSYSRAMFSDGIAASPTGWTMQEISRYFERDARRYG